jgi:catechol 2,3-dioxygenase-like lactoylglutathione lyase family enzyme
VLNNEDVFATIAVKDLKNAQRFYEETLGLKRDSGPQQATTLTLLSGKSRLLLYESKFAGTNQATAATWPVDDVAGIVAALRAKGVQFEHYNNLPGLKVEGDIHVAAGAFRVAWFKDPDGNILQIVSRRT